MIKPLESIDLPEGEEIVVYKEAEEYSDWTEKEWQRFSLHRFMKTEDDEDVDWENFFNVKNIQKTWEDEERYACG